MAPRRVLLAVADPPSLDTLERLLAESRDLLIVGRTPSGVDVLERAAELGADLVILALELPGLDRTELSRRLAEGAAALRIIFVATVDDPTTHLAAEEAGADGYFSLSDPGKRLLKLIESLLL